MPGSAEPSTPESNLSSVPLRGPDFNSDLRDAQSTGDYDLILERARESHKVFVNFNDAIKRATYLGSDCQAVAVGLNMLQTMIQTSTNQIAMLKQSAKAQKEALKNAQKGPPKEVA